MLYSSDKNKLCECKEYISMDLRPYFPRFKYKKFHTLRPALELTTMIGCPLMCSFCPQKLLKSSYSDDAKYMSIDNLKVIVKKVPKNLEFQFSGMSEPWANPSCTDMLELVLHSGFNVSIYTTLYGMSRDDVTKVSELLSQFSPKINKFVIHVPDKNGNMKGFKLTDRWLFAFDVLSNKKVFENVEVMTMDSAGVPHPSIQQLISKTPAFSGHTRAGSLDVEQITGQPISETPRNEFALTCRTTPFYDRNVLLPNGDVVLCCMDYGLEHVIGNLLQSNYNEILRGHRLKQIDKINTEACFSKKSICKKCENVRKI